MLTKNEIKNLRALHQKKYRDLERRFLVEGERLIRDLLDRHLTQIEKIFITKNFDYSNLNFADIQPIELDSLSISQLSASKSPQGIIALVKYPEQRFIDDSLILVLDQIQDPGNLGTIIRTMSWFGIRQLVCSYNTVDFCNPKVVQASMGSIFDINLVYTDLPEFLGKQNNTIYGALLEGVSLHQTKLETPSILIMGNEGNGISDEVMPFVSKPLCIPKYGNGESLNVATATAIFLNTFAAQRLAR